MPAKNSANDALTAAVLAWIEPETHVFTYRIFYDPFTKVCTHKTVDEVLDGHCVEVTLDEYEAVYFCPLFYIKQGKPTLIPVDRTAGILLKLTDTGIATVKDCNIFLADATTNLIDHWDTIDD